MTVVIYEVV